MTREAGTLNRETDQALATIASYMAARTTATLDDGRRVFQSLTPTEEVQELVGCARHRAWTLLSKLETAGLAQKVAKGAYALPRNSAAGSAADTAAQTA